MPFGWYYRKKICCCLVDFQMLRAHTWCNFRPIHQEHTWCHLYHAFEHINVNLFEKFKDIYRIFLKKYIGFLHVKYSNQKHCSHRSLKQKMELGGKKLNLKRVLWIKKEHSATRSWHLTIRFFEELIFKIKSYLWSEVVTYFMGKSHLRHNRSYFGSVILDRHNSGV